MEAAQALVLHPHAARLFPSDLNENSVWAAVKGAQGIWQLVSSNYATTPQLVGKFCENLHCKITVKPL